MIHRTAVTGATTDTRDHSSVSAPCATQWHRIRGGNDGKCAVRQRASIDGCVLAGRQLPVGRPDLSLRQPAAQATAHKGTHQAAAPRSLGDDTRFELHLRSPEKHDLDMIYITGPGH